jgi:hypothetical protein
LKKEIFEDKQKQRQLMELLGTRFTDFFEVSTKYTVSGLSAKVHSIAGSQEKLDQIRGLVKQNKPYIK